MNVRAASLFLVLCVLGAAPPRSASSGPSPGMMTTIHGVLAAVNAGDAARVGSYFAIKSTVIDENAPYVWSGSGAGETWWRAVAAMNEEGHVQQFHASALPIRYWSESGTKAYVVVPLVITLIANGKPARETGLWTLTLQRLGTVWVIDTATWATQAKT